MTENEQNGQKEGEKNPSANLTKSKYLFKP